MKKYICLILAFSLSLGLFSACKRKEETAPHPEPIPEQQVQPKPESVPIAGGELVISMPRNPDSLNPVTVKIKEMVSFLSLTFEGLVRYDENLKPQPCLAENWTVSEDGLEWTFHLRKGVMWQKGVSEFTSADVLFTLDFLKDEKTDSFYKKNIGHIESYSGPDPYTLVIRTTTPFVGLLDFMTFPVLSKDYYQGKMDDSSLLPIGTGPYQVDSYDKMKQMKLSRNTKWWKKQPYIDSIIAKAVPDNETALAAYESNQLDAVQTTSLTAGKYRESGNTEIYEYATQNYDFLAPNFNHSFFQDVRVRKAIACAIDRKEIISKVYLNHAAAVDVPVPPDSWLYNQKVNIYDYNLDNAKQLLSEAGWMDSDGDKILDKTTNGAKSKASFTLITNDDPNNPVRKDTAAIIKEQLAKVGIEVILEYHPWEEFIDLLDKRNFDMALTGYFLDKIPDLSFAFHSANIVGGQNFISYNNSEIDSLLNTITNETNQEKLKTSYMELQQKIVQELPYISLYFETGSLIARQRIKGIKAPREMDVFKTIDQWYIEK